MRVRIHNIKRRKKGDEIRKSLDYNGEVVSIGRGTNNAIFIQDLRATFHHADIYQGNDGEFFFRAHALSGVLHNGIPAEQGEFATGDRLGVGRWEIRRVPTDLSNQPSDDYCSVHELELEVEQVGSEADDDTVLQQQSKTSLNSVGPSKRRWSWILVGVVLLWFFAIPLFGKMIPAFGTLLKSVPGLPSDSVWNSGELSPAHHFFREDCTTCHQTPFLRVKDQSCVDCHQQTHTHTEIQFSEIEKLHQTRCASCHEEHNGSTGIIMQNDSFCADCHDSLTSYTANKTKLEDASDFASHHPEFRPSIPLLENGKRKVLRSSLALQEKPQEQNTIFFSHQAHLKPEGVHKTFVSERDKQSAIQANDNERVVMQCADCHTFDRGKVSTVPINFEQHCADCHQLNFEPNDSQRVVPHGDAGEVVYYLQQYYQSKALLGEIQDQQAPALVRTRRRPGKQLSQAERLIASQYALKKSREVALEVFQFRVCKTCHDVQYSSNGTPPWTIPAVLIPEIWMPMAQFTHQKHVTEDCEDCHLDVSSSEDGSDVLMPGIAICRDCHGGAHDDTLLPSTCVDCHGFHIGKALLGERQNEKQQKTIKAPDPVEQQNSASQTPIPARLEDSN